MNGGSGGGERGREVGGESERQIQAGRQRAVDWVEVGAVINSQASLLIWGLLLDVQLCVFFFRACFAGLCRCTFWTCSHRLTDLIQSPWIIPLHLESFVNDGVGMGTVERPLMVKRETNWSHQVERRRRQHLWEATHNFDRRARTCGGTHMKGNEKMMGWPWQHEKEKVWWSIFIQSVIQHN